MDNRIELGWLDRPARPSHPHGWHAGLYLGFVLAITPVFSHAQANTVHARNVFVSTNQQLHQLQCGSFVSKRPDVEYPAEGKAWFNGATVKKVEIIERDDSGDVVSDLYFDGPELVFLFESVMSFADAGNSTKQVTTNEERYFLHDGKMFKWLSGMGNGKINNPPTSAQFVQTSRSIQAAVAVFVNSAQAALPARTTRP